MFDSKWTQDNFKLVALSALMAGVLAVGAKIIADYRREVNDPGPTDEELLEELRAARDDGELDEAEYGRVKEILDRKSPNSSNGRRR